MFRSRGDFFLNYPVYHLYTVVAAHVYLTTVLPAKSDSDVMFCLKIYHGLIIDRSLVYKYISDISIRVSSSRVYELMFYSTIGNKTLSHCHSWLARQ